MEVPLTILMLKRVSVSKCVLVSLTVQVELNLTNPKVLLLAHFWPSIDQGLVKELITDLIEQRLEIR